ncbi:MAG: hypothetical protein JSR76_07415, partial [Verrucomicrobia bacterium]|nr:hypothetical protein [Verrucomicrobiota bacterium]
SSPSAPPPGAPTLVSAASPSVSREGSPPRTATPPPSAPAAANPAPLTPASALPATPRVAATPSPAQPLPPVAPQIERRGFDKAVTTPVVGSLVAFPMLFFRTAQTVGCLALAFFQRVSSLFAKGISKEVEHKYGEKAIRAAKGMFVAVVALFPFAGPPLARLVLERWVDRKAAVKV